MTAYALTPLFTLPGEKTKHPAKYTYALLPSFVRMLRGCTRILDPFGGTGKVFLLEYWLPGVQIDAVEIEPEWAAQHPKTTLGNALYLPWPAATFDAVCTSPAYGNRMADTLLRDVYKRRTYASELARELHPDNGGRLQWGDRYRAFHVDAWTEARRVLRPGGRMVLNIKDHIRDGKLQRVTDWHTQALTDLGFVVQDHVKVNCPGMRFGRNGNTRVDYESVILLELRNDAKARSH